MARRLELGQYCGRSVRRRQVHQFVVTENRFKPGLEIAAHAHTHPHFTFVIEGGFTERYGNRELRCGSNSMLFVPADATHTDIIGPEGAHSIGVELSQGAANRMSDGIEMLRRAEVVIYEPILMAAQRLYREFFSQDAASKLCIESLALEILAHSARMPQTSPQGVPVWMSRVIERLRDGFRDSLSLEDLALDAGVHHTHLARVFRRVHGCTVGEYVRRLRIEQGASDLRRSDKSITQIAVDAGFCDPSHFAREFRKAYGLTPASYRVSLR